MRLGREIFLGLGALIALQILTSMLAIALLARMAPAIERLLIDNVASGEAVEEMLALIASTPIRAAQPESFETALARAEKNITEEEEHTLVEEIKRHQGAAFAGEISAREKLITALRRLGQVNRDSMALAAARAQAGAWAAALLGASALALGILVYRRLRLRIELPLETLRQTVERLREGNLQSRCVTTDGPIELKQITLNLNWLLDKWLQREPQQVEAKPERTEDLRLLLGKLLDERPTPSIIVDANRIKVAASLSALHLNLPQPSDQEWEDHPIEGTSLRLFFKRPEPPKVGSD